MTLLNVCYVIGFILFIAVSGKLTAELNPKRRWLAAYALLFLMLALLPLLDSCKPKAKPTTPVVVSAPTVDSTRIRLQNRADTSRSRADQAADASNSAVTDYETDAKTYDALRNPLR